MFQAILISHGRSTAFPSVHAIPPPARSVTQQTVSGNRAPAHAFVRLNQMLKGDGTVVNLKNVR